MGVWGPGGRETPPGSGAGEGGQDPEGYFYPLWGHSEALTSMNPSFLCRGRYPGVAPGTQGFAHLMPVCPRPMPELTTSADRRTYQKLSVNPTLGCNWLWSSRAWEAGAVWPVKGAWLCRSLRGHWLHGLGVFSLSPHPRTQGLWSPVKGVSTEPFMAESPVSA